MNKNINEKNQKFFEKVKTDIFNPKEKNINNNEFSEVELLLLNSCTASLKSILNGKNNNNINYNKQDNNQLSSNNNSRFLNPYYINPSDITSSQTSSNSLFTDNINSSQESTMSNSANIFGDINNLNNYINSNDLINDNQFKSLFVKGIIPYIFFIIKIKFILFKNTLLIILYLPNYFI